MRRGSPVGTDTARKTAQSTALPLISARPRTGDMRCSRGFPTDRLPHLERAVARRRELVPTSSSAVDQHGL